MRIDHRVSRRYTTALLEAADEGALNKDTLIRDLVGFLSEQEVREFCQMNDLVEAIGMQEADNSSDDEEEEEPLFPNWEPEQRRSV